jgi:hypothetical protein
LVWFLNSDREKDYRSAGRIRKSSGERATTATKKINRGRYGPEKERRETMTIYDLLWKEGEDKSGKARWSKVGILMEKSDGKKSVKLNSLPVGSWDGWLVVSEKRERDDRAF